MIRIISLLKSIASIAIIFVPVTAYATNGMFLIGSSNKSRAMGGASIAYADRDSVAGAANPALIAKAGRRFDIDAFLFKPEIESRLGIGTPTDITSESLANGIGIDNIFIMGGAGITFNINDKWDFGFIIDAVGGGVTQYDKNLYNAQGGKSVAEPLGINLMLGNLLPTLSYKINDKHTIGASLIIGIQRFRAYGLGEFSQFAATSPTTGMTDNGNEWTYGAGLRFGWLGDFGKLDIGVVATTETYFQKFEKYDQLFAEQGSLNTPPSIGAGLSYEFTDDLTIAVDLEHTFYSEVPAISNIGPNHPGDPNGPFPVSKEVNGLGADEGLGFGWEDQTVIKIGAAYDFNEEWIGRVGWNYGKSPVDESREILFNIMAPAVVQHHLTLGFTWRINPKMDLSASYVHAFRFYQEGPTFIGSRGSTEMSQNSLGLGFGMSF